MRQRDLEHFRSVLEDRLAILYRAAHAKVRLGMYEGTNPPYENIDPGDEGDEAQRTLALDAGIALSEREAALGQRIEAALRRIRTGEFGRCIDCDQPIELSRLRLVPWTERCIADQEALETEARGRHPPSL